MEFTADTLLATVTGAVAVPITQQPPVEEGAAHLVPKPVIIIEAQGSGKTPVQKMVECASRLESEDTKFIQAKENRQAAEHHYKEACQRLQVCKRNEAQVQRRLHAAYQLLLRAVHEVAPKLRTSESGHPT